MQEKPCNMEHLLVFAIMAVGIYVVIDAKSDEEACVNLMKNMKNMCCETMNAMKHEDDHKCKKDDGKWTCEDSVCVLDKRGLMNGDNVDESKFEELMGKWEEKNADVGPMILRVKDKCLGEKYKELPADVCDATRFHMCVGLNCMVECKNWKDDDACKELPEDAKQCKSILDKNEK